MTFLEGAFLAGMLGAAIPFILHLLHRRRVRRVPFPSLRFLREIEVRTARRKRIREWAILFLRAAAILVLALALSRPVLRQSSLGHGASSRVFVVDNSMSMSSRLAGSSALERSLIVVESVLERAGPADRAAVFPVHGERLPLTESRSDAQRALAAIEPTYRATPLWDLVRAALEEVEEESSPVKEIYVLSDLQASALEGAERPPEVPGGVSLIFLRPLSDPGPNVAIASAEVIGDGSLLRTTLVAHGGEAVRRVRFLVDGKAVAERAVRVPAGGESRALFRVPELTPGLHRGVLRAEGDVLPSDDALEVSIPARETPGVLVVRDASAARSGRDPAFFLTRALVAGSRSAGALRVGVTSTDRLKAESIAGIDVIFLLEPRAIDAAAGRVLSDFVLRGGGLFISTGPGGESGDLELRSRDGASGSPVTLGPVRRASDAPLRLSAWNDRHPVWRPLVESSPPLRPDLPAFSAVRSVTAAEGSEILATFSSGDPALIVRRWGEGKVLFFASTITTDWGNLPLRYVFAPWVHAIVRFLAPGALRPEERIAGTRLILRHPGESGFTEASLEPPEGATRRAAASVEAAVETPAAVGTGTAPGSPAPAKGAAASPGRTWAVADLGLLERPGVHVLEESFSGERRRRHLAVKAPEAESDLEPMPEGSLRELFPGAFWIAWKSPREALAGALSVTVGSELKNHLLLVLLGLLLIEPLLANRTAFRRERQRRESAFEAGPAPRAGAPAGAPAAERESSLR